MLTVKRFLTLKNTEHLFQYNNLFFLNAKSNNTHLTTHKKHTCTFACTCKSITHVKHRLIRQYWERTLHDQLYFIFQEQGFFFFLQLEIKEQWRSNEKETMHSSVVSSKCSNLFKVAKTSFEFLSNIDAA